MQHTTVLLQESVDALALQPGNTAIDCTLGLGGHTVLLAEAVGEAGRVLGLDVDEGALEAAKERLARFPQVSLRRANFRDLTSVAKSEGFGAVDGILFDLGWNSTQLEAGRGFSFCSHEPLVMTLSSPVAEGALTAHEIVNTWSEEDIADIVQTLGEERFARRIARAIVEARATAPIAYADELADIVASAVPKRTHGRIHPATKTFQALRMMVNDELSSLERALPEALGLLRSGGKMAVITFHSLEDGLVKRIFKKFAASSEARLVTKKPTVPSQTEVRSNPRSRSAKLRVIEKL